MAGRKPIELDARAVKALAATGLTEKQIAEVLGISYSTLRNRKRQYKEFAELLTLGRAQGLASVSNALFNSAKNGNFQAMRYYLLTRDRKNWDDTGLTAMETGLPMTVTFGVAPAVGDVKVTRGKAKDE